MGEYLSEFVMSVISFFAGYGVRDFIAKVKHKEESEGG